MNIGEERESTRAESVDERHCNRKKDGIPNAVLCNCYPLEEYLDLGKYSSFLVTMMHKYGKIMHKYGNTMQMTNVFEGAAVPGVWLDIIAIAATFKIWNIIRVSFLLNEKKYVPAQKTRMNS